MKYSVGYPCTKNETFIDEIIKAKDFVFEVYFAFGEFANGRSPQDYADSSEMPWESRQREIEDLRRLTEADIKLNFLLNGNCYGDEALSRAFYMKIGDTLDWLISRFSVASVTTTSPHIGKFIHANFKGIDVRASVNIGIGSITSMDMASEFFDSYYIKRELNRSLEKIREMRGWCNKAGKGLYMLANSGCFNNCPAHTYHDNLVAHEIGISKHDNAYSFSAVCREYLKNPDKRISIIRDMNYVRPEDIRLYEGLVDAVKLATRVNKRPERVLEAYIRGQYSGSLCDLLEPDNGSAIQPYIIDNSLFPQDFGEFTANCAKNCGDCDYCKNVLEKTSIYLG